jgi:hypothetical protein
MAKKRGKSKKKTTSMESIIGSAIGAIAIVVFVGIIVAAVWQYLLLGVAVILVGFIAYKIMMRSARPQVQQQPQMVHMPSQQMKLVQGPNNVTYLVPVNNKQRSRRNRS